MNTEQQIFKDKKGNPIVAGDILLHTFYARWRERPGYRRVAIEGMSGKEVIIYDVGNLREPQEHWVKYHVKWDGACLIAERGECSDFQVLMNAEHFDEKGNPIYEGAGFHYINNAFNSKAYVKITNQE